MFHNLVNRHRMERRVPTGETRPVPAPPGMGGRFECCDRRGQDPRHPGIKPQRRTPNIRWARPVGRRGVLDDVQVSQER